MPRGSADFARARVLAALDLLSWLDRRGQALSDLTQADVDHWLAGGAITRLGVPYSLQLGPRPRPGWRSGGAASPAPGTGAAQQAVDAMVAATAIEQAKQAEAADRSASVLIVTSDLPDLTKLVAGRPRVAVVRVSRLGQSSSR